MDAARTSPQTDQMSPVSLDSVIRPDSPNGKMDISPSLLLFFSLLRLVFSFQWHQRDRQRRPGGT